jgi:hypothetical protein
MKREVRNWRISQLHKERASITFPEYQRQERLWSDEKKSLLIDSILKDIDIPKLYFNEVPGGVYEVVDGQQRLWAIWDFLDGLYTYKHGDAPAKFSLLTAKQQEHIASYQLQITVFKDADEEYLRELFLRLQLGLLLNTGEKLHATSGLMKDFIFDKFAKHKFVKALGMPQKRYANETLGAQIAINSFTRSKLGTFVRTRYEDLNYFFQEYARPHGKELEFFKERTSHILHVLDELSECFGDKARDLKNRSYIISIYLLYEDLTTDKDMKHADQRVFAEFILKLWIRLREEVSRGFDRKNRELYAFETLVSSAPGEKYQIQRRHEKLAEYYRYYVERKRIQGDS